MGATPNRRCLPGCLSDAFLVTRPTNHDKDERDGNAKAGGLTTTRTKLIQAVGPSERTEPPRFNNEWRASKGRPPSICHRTALSSSSALTYYDDTNLPCCGLRGGNRRIISNVAHHELLRYQGPYGL